MIPTKDLIESCIYEVRPLVKQKNQLKITEKDLPIKLKKNDTSRCFFVCNSKG
ncbi:MAG: hypothetical protein QJ16_C0001G0034 [archaeon GW2011_AR1]|nr:MAG: hypothetical protein QJ16_C0001G0034 [archaeon GW2011_AR1]